MIKTNDSQSAPVHAGSPFELRTDMARNVNDSAIRQAVVTGDTGFLHSFTTGSVVDGPGVRVVGWLSGCHWRCVYCHNPDTWHLKDGT